ncbi:hypothetical protein BJ742DRAFT_528881 [Cladochytrium replicatum]|nr:hypothetical protein BJ742DRAFT_528881 [Cladochytrium replicatum]
MGGHSSRALDLRDDEVCAICLRNVSLSNTPEEHIEDNDENESMLTLLDVCRHPFHFGCVHAWSNVSTTCPTDRLEFKKLLVYGEDGLIQREVAVEAKRAPSVWGNEEVVEEVTYCEVCRLRDREDVMLLCDRCDLGYHTYCVNLSDIPSGEWFCPTCTAISVSDENDDVRQTTPTSTSSQPRQSRRSIRRSVLRIDVAQSPNDRPPASVVEFSRSRRNRRSASALESLRRELLEETRQRLDELRRYRRERRSDGRDSLLGSTSFDFHTQPHQASSSSYNWPAATAFAGSKRLRLEEDSRDSTKRARIGEGDPLSKLWREAERARRLESSLTGTGSSQVGSSNPTITRSGPSTNLTDRRTTNGKHVLQTNPPSVTSQAQTARGIHVFPTNPPSTTSRTQNIAARPSLDRTSVANISSFSQRSLSFPRKPPPNSAGSASASNITRSLSAAVQPTASLILDREDGLKRLDALFASESKVEVSPTPVRPSAESSLPLKRGSLPSFRKAQSSSSS